MIMAWLGCRCTVRSLTTGAHRQVIFTFLYMGMGCSSSSTAAEEPRRETPAGPAQPRAGGSAPAIRTTGVNNGNPAGNAGHRPMAGTRPLALPPTTYPSATPLTREQLEKERSEFWATRVTGIQEVTEFICIQQVWNYLKMACDALIEGDAGTANAIVEAANIRTPMANLTLCYDERGGEYRVADFCYSTPVAEEEEATSPNSSNSNDHNSSSSSSSKSKRGGSTAAVAAGGSGGEGGGAAVGVALKVKVRVAGYQKDFEIGGEGGKTTGGENGGGSGGGGGGKGAEGGAATTEAAAEEAAAASSGIGGGEMRPLTDLTTVLQFKLILEKEILQKGQSAGGPAAVDNGNQGLPVARMRLILGGRTIDKDDATLRSFGVKDESVIQVFPRPAVPSK